MASYSGAPGGPHGASCPADLTQPLWQGGSSGVTKSRNAASAVATPMPGGPPVPRVFLLLLILRKQWHLYALHGFSVSPSPTMAPFNPPPREMAPSLTACVRRALDTKGGVSRFSAHFTSIHQKRNENTPPCTSGRAEAGPALPTRTIPPKTATLLWWGVKTTLFRDHWANVAPDYFYLPHKTSA